MAHAVYISGCCSLALATIAALCDWRRGQIPNWLTLPPLVVSPFVYGLAFGLEHALHSVLAGVLGGLVPYLLFRRAAMGGGDVKLFAALGTISGFDLALGIEIQVWAFAFALIAAGAVLAWRGRLLRTLGNGLAFGLGPALPRRWRRSPCDELSTPIRMGGPILLATCLVAVPSILVRWGTQ